MNRTVEHRAKFSIPSLIAIAAALLSFTTGAFWGFVLAGIAIACGIVGVVLSFSPSVRGGFVSILSLLAGGIALIAAVIKAVMWLL